jgi:LPXTG-motif cell wall-anchored protein
MRNILKYTILASVLALCASSAAFASPDPCSSTRPDCRSTPEAPEVDPALAVAGITALAGGLAVLRARRRK